MIAGDDKDFVKALLKRNYTMQETSDLLRKRNPSVRGFLLLWFSVFPKIINFLQGESLTWNSKHIVRKAVKV